jgi:hypothetical protein
VVDLDGRCPRTTLAVGEPELRIDWSVPPRAVRDVDHLSALPPSTDFISPPTWPVQLNACDTIAGANGVAGYRWELVSEATGETFRTSATICLANLKVSELGYYQAYLTITDRQGAEFTATKTILMHDYLIVSLGDSVASGEGNPDREAYYLPPSAPATWANRQCHRSWSSGPAQAAVALEQADPRTSVTYVSLGCSGAGLWEGLLQEYAGKEPNGDPMLRPQLEEIFDLVAGRAVHAVFLNAGANDIYFGDIATACLLNPFDDCYNLTFTDPDTNDYYAPEFVRRQLARLPGLYAQVADRLSGLVNPNQVYISEYHDPVHGSAGGPCEIDLVNVNGDSGAVLWPEESTWAYQDVVLPLNERVHDAATAHGWNFVGGIAADFLTHGYCAQDSWVRSIPQSLYQQGNRDGTLHPNFAGHTDMANHLIDAVWPTLLPIGAAVTCPWGHDPWDGMCLPPLDPGANGDCFDRCDQQLNTCYGNCQGPDREMCMCLCDNSASSCCIGCGGVSCGGPIDC